MEDEGQYNRLSLKALQYVDGEKANGVVILYGLK
jgi:hypothetical protein